MFRIFFIRIFTFYVSLPSVLCYSLERLMKNLDLHECVCCLCYGENTKGTLRHIKTETIFGFKILICVIEKTERAADGDDDDIVTIILCNFASP